jgi:hypothetical protein
MQLEHFVTFLDLQRWYSCVVSFTQLGIDIKLDLESCDLFGISGFGEEFFSQNLVIDQSDKGKGQLVADGVRVCLTAITIVQERCATMQLTIFPSTIVWTDRRNALHTFLMITSSLVSLVSASSSVSYWSL